MEMESSRRPPFDRSRAMLKKPRLTTEDSGVVGRQFQQQRPANAPIAGSALATRFRTNEREREPDDPVRGALQQYQQHQELVNQYKTALAELTFNSKPIITNLTIIAGENLQAAKAIAATICSNIIEVPSEQKLPSLYLLDSIVKNIGRDYIKYFAARLPEVFCKAYRQVDPSTHPGMRHLFGTWKGVFPPQSLQIIEKELGFPTAVNGPSSGSATSKSDSQSQRPAHSIHVNPKYLEARQRLQQSNRPKGTAIGGADVESSEDGGSDRTSSAETERPWTDPSMKLHSIQRPQREALRDPNHQKQGGAGYGDYDIGSGLSRPLSTSIGKPSERLIGQSYDKRWLGRSREVEESLSSQRNGFDVKRGIPNYTATRSASGSVPSIPNAPSSAEMSRSWKNSEEEEYSWDDLGPRVADPGAISSTKKELWSADDLEKVGYNPQDLGGHLPKWQNHTEARSTFEREPSTDSLSSDQKEQVAFGHPRSSQWKVQEPHQIDSSSPLLPQVGARSATGASPAGLSSFGFPNTVSGSAGSVVQRHTSPGQSPMHQRPPSPSLSKRDPRQNLVERDHMRSQSLGRSDPRIASLSGQLNLGLRDQSSQNSLPGRHQNLQSGNMQKLLSHTLPKASSTTSAPPLKRKHHVPSSEQMPIDHSEAELSGNIQRAEQLLGSSSLMGEASSKRLNPLAADSQGPSDISSLLAVMKSGLLSGSSVSGQVGTSQMISTSSKGAITSPGPSYDSVTTPFSQRKAEKPPLPRVPLSSSISSAAAPASDVASASSNPLSSLFSTLVAKGLISASKTESVAPVSVPSENQLKEQSPKVATAPVIVPSVPKTSAVSQIPSTDELSSAEPATKISDPTAQSTKVEIENLIGFEFRPRLLRELHEPVIDRLSENLPHKCTACGLQFKLQERLERHLEWHTYRNSIPNSLNKPSRRWYSNSADWIAGNAGFPFGYNSSSLIEESNKTGEEDEKMVPADECQCVCLLCGELFEDFYSQEKDAWMFKGAVYLSIPSASNGGGPSTESAVRNLIVHANCMSDDSARDLGIISDIKSEKAA